MVTTSLSRSRSYCFVALLKRCHFRCAPTTPNRDKTRKRRARIMHYEPSQKLETHPPRCSAEIYRQQPITSITFLITVNRTKSL
jgi:hypothetical protein